MVYGVVCIVTNSKTFQQLSSRTRMFFLVVHLQYMELLKSFRLWPEDLLKLSKAIPAADIDRLTMDNSDAYLHSVLGESLLSSTSTKKVDWEVCALYHTEVRKTLEKRIGKQVPSISDFKWSIGATLWGSLLSDRCIDKLGLHSWAAQHGLGVDVTKMKFVWNLTPSVLTVP